jgi:hypothetical protein
MKKFLIVAIAVLAMASTSDAYAQSWGRRGADAYGTAISREPPGPPRTPGEYQTRRCAA